MSIIEIKDKNGLNISARNTYLRKSDLKLKNSKDKKKLKWKLIHLEDDKFYVKNVKFKSFLFYDKKLSKIYLSKNKKTKWDISDGYIKSDNIYLSNELKPDKKPYKWYIEKSYNINYIIYIQLTILSGILLVLIGCLFVKKSNHPYTILFIYLILILLIISVLNLKI